MPAIEECCRQCSKTYKTQWPEGYQEFCSVGCRVDFYNQADEEYAASKEQKDNAVG